jgi:hypothetical protein
MLAVQLPFTGVSFFETGTIMYPETLPFIEEEEITPAYPPTAPLGTPGLLDTREMQNEIMFSVAVQ